MIFTEPQNHIIQNIQLIRKDYDLLGSYRLYHSNILEEGLDYIPIQYLTNNTFGFSFRVIKDTFILQIAYSNRNRKFYKNDIVKFEFENGEWLEFKLISGTIKDFNNLNSAVILIKPEHVKLFLFENFKSIEIKSKRNEIGYIKSDLNATLEYYSISNEFYQNLINYILTNLLQEYLKDWPGNNYSRLLG